MSVPLRHGILFVVVVLAGLWLRVDDLAARPMHADEANQAVKLGDLLEGRGYRFDPADHHGPTLYYFALIPAWLRGEHTLRELTETTVRLVPAAFGTASIVLLWLLLAPATTESGPIHQPRSTMPAGTAGSPWPALAGALLFAVSPPSVYYARYFVQETLLVTFTLGTLVCGQRWGRTGRPGWAAGLGACAGLMFATKASALLYAAAAVLAVLAAGGGGRVRELLRRRSALAAGAATSVVVWALFYSSFGTHPGGLADAWASLSPMASRAAGGATGHEKPWWYYGSLFVFQQRGGYYWDQTVFTLLALAGVVLAFAGGGRPARFWAVFTLLVALALSLAPYKTPWNALGLVPGLCALAALALGRMRPAGALPLASAACLVLGWQTMQAAFWRPADPRNPWAYVHTATDLLRLPALAAAAPAGPVKVISEEYWPLPWYLRQRPDVGYFPAPPADCDGALVIASAGQAEFVMERLRDRYQFAYLGLRPGFVLVVFTPVPK